MIYDCFPFFNELDLLEIRFEELYDVVDKFVLVEADKSFRGIPKEFVFYNNRNRFLKYKDKIKYLRYTMPNGSLGLVHEWDNKNSLMSGLTECKNDDIILFGDVDEIPRRKELIESINLFKEQKYDTVTFKMDWFNYFLNGKFTKSDGDGVWYGTIMFNYKFLEQNPNLVKIRNSRGLEDNNRIHINKSGWHFTFVGDEKLIQSKIVNWTHWGEYLDKNSLEYISQKMNENKALNDTGHIDIISVDNSFPLAVINDYNKYRHLIKEQK